MEKLNPKDRDTQLIGIAAQKEITLSLITWVMDNYPDHPATNLLKQNLKGAYDQFQKIILSVATGENEPEKQTDETKV
jgi:hypothetical protein